MVSNEAVRVVRIEERFEYMCFVRRSGFFSRRVEEYWIRIEELRDGRSFGGSQCYSQALVLDSIQKGESRFKSISRIRGSPTHSEGARDLSRSRAVNVRSRR